MATRHRGAVVAAVLTGLALVAPAAGHAPAGQAAATEFPAGDERYHTYAEVAAELAQVAQRHPRLAQVRSAGTSFEGRRLHLVKLSADVARDEREPEILITCGQHAREHLSTEMCLRVVERFTTGYGKDERVTALMRSREIYVLPLVNPDGAEYDIAGGQYRGWRKTRSRHPGSRAVGVDPNRNWGYRWGCCGGSSGRPSSPTYRGPRAFSEPETRAVAAFVASRVRDGKQQLVRHVDFHAYGELVLWPYGWTSDAVAEGMTAEQNARFVSLGTRMARRVGYTAQQASELYVTDGAMDDWMWGRHRVLSFTVEMYPAEGDRRGFYPPDEVIDRETRRLDSLVEEFVSG